MLSERGPERGRRPGGDQAHLSNSHGKLGSSAGCPPTCPGVEAPRSKASPGVVEIEAEEEGEGAGEWGAAEAGQAEVPRGPQEAGGGGGAADSPQHSTTVRDGVLITGVDAYRHKKDTEGSLVTSSVPLPQSGGWSSHSPRPTLP